MIALVIYVVFCYICLAGYIIQTKDEFNATFFLAPLFLPFAIGTVLGYMDKAIQEEEEKQAKNKK